MQVTNSGNGGGINQPDLECERPLSLSTTTAAATFGGLKARTWQLQDIWAATSEKSRYKGLIEPFTTKNLSKFR
jgi:hypothetical protein